MNEPITSIIDLPDALLEMIFQRLFDSSFKCSHTRLRSIPELGSLRLVCRRFYEVTQPDYFWKDIVYSHMKTLNDTAFKSLFTNNASQQEELRQQVNDALTPVTVDLVQLFLEDLIQRPLFSSTQTPWMKLCSTIHSMLKSINLYTYIFYRSFLD